MVLPTPSDLLFKLYEQQIFNFIWNGKPDKIKRAYLYNEYELLEGGKLFNIKAFKLSLKASVKQKLHLNNKWFSSKLVKIVQECYLMNLPVEDL